MTFFIILSYSFFTSSLSELPGRYDLTTSQVRFGTENNACAYINEGVLSELVVFGTNLYANVAGPSEDSSTLYRVPALPGDIISNRGGWRDSSY